MKNIFWNTFNLILVMTINLVKAQFLNDDCAKINSFINSEKVKCCDDSKIICNGSGFITEINLMNTDIGEGFYNNEFPIFDKLTDITLRFYSGKKFPSTFFDQPNIKSILILNSTISEIPMNINPKCPVTKI